jgi:glycosyltransferase involved in cell wall biosynthesis
MVWEKLHEAFEDWELTIIGDGPEKHELKKIVQNKKLQRVTFISFTTHPEKYYKESEILCLTSDFEGCPMVLLEAQQHGCAAIAFDCSYGVRDILSPNWTNGVFIPNGDIDEYAQALAKLMEDKALRRTIQRNGLENVKRFSISTSVEQYDALINNICSENQE